MIDYIKLVAPLAGAWIETVEWNLEIRESWVAPLAGAWIDTPVIRPETLPSLSHPSRVRGLKHSFVCS